MDLGLLVPCLHGIGQVTNNSELIAAATVMQQIGWDQSMHSLLALPSQQTRERDAVPSRPR